MRHSANEKLPNTLLSAGKGNSNQTFSEPLTAFEMRLMFKVTWDGMRRNHFQHMHSKVDEEQTESRLVEYRKRVGVAREMNSLLNKQTPEVVETPHSKRTRSQAIQNSNQAKEMSNKRVYNTKPTSKE